MPVERMMPTPEAADLIDLVREIAARDLAPVAAGHEAAGTFPRDTFRLLGKAGLLGLVGPERHGGGGQPYEVYLQVLEEIATAWMSVAVGVSVHTLSCYPLVAYGTETQRRQWLPAMLGGDLLGAYSLSEAQSGSDAASLRTRAERQADGGYRVTGTKAWVTHGGQADFYTLFARTAPGQRGISCFLVPAGAPGLAAARPEEKMGLTASTTAQLHLDGVPVPAERLVGAEGEGFPIAMSALDAGRLGIAACATGLAQAALDAAVAYAHEREQFGRPVASFQGLSFMFADMAAAVASARATYLDAARRMDRGLPVTREAAIAKLVCTDGAMRVTTDAVQALGGYGYTKDFPVERYMREAKVTQIFEGTNQIQRIVISRALAAGAAR
ncbi:acyl-CoA dehydrogenase family protein [Phytohabitans houttuyneae]|uniref:Acyl-CoA dehydrogenase n=1 Tax=Phytohabitans houttuyneae TaxID=1076126 RepID=A0A6V8KNT6_9ACTN|nr:acyl-CoA dehydrogenase family protein [Phytohabitans houttuyneae]GFJ82355.1 acyl-CoA dehydrogenase [Phytohabitans houttuyneae]